MVFAVVVFASVSPVGRLGLAKPAGAGKRKMGHGVLLIWKKITFLKTGLVKKLVLYTKMNHLKT